jgi:septin family protein
MEYHLGMDVFVFVRVCVTVVAGESGLGKTTFINTLFTTTIKDYKNPNKRHEKQLEKTVDILITKAGKLVLLV